MNAEVGTRNVERINAEVGMQELNAESGMRNVERMNAECGRRKSEIGNRSFYSAFRFPHSIFWQLYTKGA